MKSVWNLSVEWPIFDVLLPSRAVYRETNTIKTCRSRVIDLLTSFHLAWPVLTSGLIFLSGSLDSNWGWIYGPVILTIYVGTGFNSDPRHDIFLELVEKLVGVESVNVVTQFQLGEAWVSGARIHYCLFNNSHFDLRLYRHLNNFY